MTSALAISGTQMHGLLYAPVGIFIAVYCWRRGVPVTQNYRWTGIPAKIIAVMIVLITIIGVLAVMFTPQIERYIDRMDAQAKHRPIPN